MSTVPDGCGSIAADATFNAPSKLSAMKHFVIRFYELIMIFLQLPEALSPIAAVP
jgi:hypothetical protein